MSNGDPHPLDAAATRRPEAVPATGFGVGTLVDNRYTITGPGIPGGMGVVYPVTHRELNEPRALKVMHPHLVADPESVERFREEARLSIKLQHPAIVRVFD